MSLHTGADLLFREMTHAEKNVTNTPAEQLWLEFRGGLEGQPRGAAGFPLDWVEGMTIGLSAPRGRLCVCLIHLLLRHQHLAHAQLTECS